jgi:hypothetical protein
MLKQILEMLPLVEIGKSELIDIAKGKYKIATNIKELKKQIKWQLSK